MTLYGLYGITHGWAKVLTVMGPVGAAAVAAHIEPGPDIIAETGEGQLPVYQEKRDGALAALIARYDIAVLDKPGWDIRKAELGDKIW